MQDLELRAYQDIYEKLLVTAGPFYLCNHLTEWIRYNTDYKESDLQNLFPLFYKYIPDVKRSWWPREDRRSRLVFLEKLIEEKQNEKI
jgi:hypothetical protein